MKHHYSFRFADDKRNGSFISLLKRHHIEHAVDADGTVHYSKDDEEFVENELLQQIRDRVFPSWQVISCPKDWVERYKLYMTTHKVPFAEELIDEELCFLVPRNYQPHSWRL